MFVVAIAGGTVMTLAWGLLFKLMPPDDRGAISGLATTTKGIGLIVGPLLAGALIDILRPYLPADRRVPGAVADPRRADPARDPARRLADRRREAGPTSGWLLGALRTSWWTYRPGSSPRAEPRARAPGAVAAILAIGAGVARRRCGSPSTAARLEDGAVRSTRPATSASPSSALVEARVVRLGRVPHRSEIRRDGKRARPKEVPPVGSDGWPPSPATSPAGGLFADCVRLRLEAERRPLASGTRSPDAEAQGSRRRLEQAPQPVRLLEPGEIELRDGVPAPLTGHLTTSPRSAPDAPLARQPGPSASRTGSADPGPPPTPPG